jgi:hypothetical protein
VNHYEKIFLGQKSTVEKSYTRAVKSNTVMIISLKHHLTGKLRLLERKLD